MFEVTILTITSELSQSEYDALLHLVSHEKQERIKKFHSKRDAQNCLLGDIVARIEICCSTQFNMKQLEFAVNEYGKPRIQSSISHAGHYIACAIDDEPVGIDIEIINLLN